LRSERGVSDVPKRLALKLRKMEAKGSIWFVHAVGPTKVYNGAYVDDATRHFLPGHHFEAKQSSNPFLSLSLIF